MGLDLICSLHARRHCYCVLLYMVVGCINTRCGVTVNGLVILRHRLEEAVNGDVQNIEFVEMIIPLFPRAFYQEEEMDF